MPDSKVGYCNPLPRRPTGRKAGRNREAKAVNRKTALALNAINTRFYGELALEFSSTREAPWPGWLRVLSNLERRAGDRELAVLDVGCGNGRFATFLAENLGNRRERLHYLGVDASGTLLEHAGAKKLPFATTEYRGLDFVESHLGEALGPRDFDLVVLFGVLHHIPGAARRQQLLDDVCAHLRPGGLVALTAWQFEAFERFRDKVLPWDEYNRTAESPVDTRELESGDHLLPWGQDAVAVRYCHFADEKQTRQVLDDLPLEIVETYTADGREGNLNRYFLLRKSETNDAPRNPAV